ncbi:MAG TPA: PepSY-like domain-containing protein [Puia sp.]|nr:PepSY-like domain-containing protein [Puia sp.]
MKKILFCCLLSGGLLMTHVPVHAQLRSLPSAVTDSFKVKYPNAAQVSWSDKLGYWQASFYLGPDAITAKFRNTGEWQSAMKRIAQTSLPAEVQDGFAKSLYADGDWRVTTVDVLYLPRDVTQYAVQVEKSSLQRRNLLFNSKGRLIKENAAL